MYNCKTSDICFNSCCRALPRNCTVYFCWLTRIESGLKIWKYQLFINDACDKAFNWTHKTMLLVENQFMFWYVKNTLRQKRISVHLTLWKRYQSKYVKIRSTCCDSNAHSVLFGSDKSNNCGIEMEFLIAQYIHWIIKKSRKKFLYIW